MTATAYFAVAVLAAWLLVFGLPLWGSKGPLHGTAVKIHHPEYKVYNISPFCVQPGLGWVWYEGELPDVGVMTEGRRVVRPHDLRGTLPPPITWNTTSVPYLGTIDPLSLLHQYPLYHFLWSFISTTMTRTHLQGTHPTLIPFYQTCPTPHDWQEVAWLGTNWTTTAHTHLSPCLPPIDRTRILPTPTHPIETHHTSPVCYPYGLVGAMRMRHLASRYDIVYDRWAGGAGSVNCKSKKCKFPGVGRAWAPYAPILTGRIYASLGMETAPLTRVVLIDRQRSRRILNIGSVAAEGQGKEEGWEVQVVKLEELSTLEQLRLVGTAAVVMGVHGSGLAWCLLGREGTVWVELVPHGPGSRRTSVNSNASFIAVDAAGLPTKKPNRKISIRPLGLEGYGVLARYTGGHHISWTASCANCTRCPPADSGTLYAFKGCDINVPMPAARTMLREAVELHRNRKRCQSGCLIEVKYHFSHMHLKHTAT